MSSGKLLVSVTTKENLGHKPEIKQYQDYNLKKNTSTNNFVGITFIY